MSSPNPVVLPFERYGSTRLIHQRPGAFVEIQPHYGCKGWVCTCSTQMGIIPGGEWKTKDYIFPTLGALCAHFEKTYGVIIGIPDDFPHGRTEEETWLRQFILFDPVKNARLLKSELWSSFVKVMESDNVISFSFEK